MRDFLLSVGYDRWILPALLLIPVVGAVIIGLGSVSGDGGPTPAAPATGDHADVPPITASAQFARWVALVTFVVEFVVSVGLWWTFDPAAAGWQSTIHVSWIPAWGISFYLGIDGLALVLILLTTFLLPLTVLGSWTSVRTRVPSFYVLMLILTSGMLGVFMSLDLFLFYVMWEVMLIPMYFIIGIWGGERRIYASIKFFLYTFLGSLLMLVAILYVGFHVGSPRGEAATADFSYPDLLARLSLTPVVARWLFGAFFVAFAVKVPMFPFHTWLPDAHTEAPTAGSVILAGIMLKMGTYGFLRFALPLFPSAAIDPTIRAVILALAVVGILYGALVALVQPDFKRLVAYSSVSHLGFVMLGIFALTQQSVQGAILVMINHGISTGALFLLVGMIYERTHSRMISAYGGIARVVPLFAAILTFVSLSSIGLPGTNGFVGEFLVLIGSYRSEPYFVLFATVGVIFAAAYLLWAIQRILFNALDKPENASLRDLNWRELGLMAPLLASLIWLGIYPAPVLRRTQLSALAVVQQVDRTAPPPHSQMPSRPSQPRNAPPGGAR
jgi:NADH-quinone oxidoreductase subunit M